MYAVTNPATGEIEAEFATASDEQIQQALSSTDQAYQAWSVSALDDRVALLNRVADIYETRADELAAIITREMGKPIKQSLGEISIVVAIYRYYAKNGPKFLEDEELEIASGGRALVRKESVGVLLGIMPWNFPYYQVARFAAPNLVLGNTIILKHAPQCPESAAAIEKMYLDAGFPIGAYVNVYATNDQAAVIIADPRVQGVSVTGSERAGAAVAELAGRNLKKVALELGGSDPFILLSTDDIDAAVAGAVDARLDNNGQSCNAPKRFIVVDGLYDTFLQKFTDAMKAQVVGDPFADGTTVGPLSSLPAAERLAAQVDRAVAQGATLVTGGTRDGAFYTPTVLTGVTPEMDVYREELFGPASVVYRVADEDAAVALANDTSFGLGSYVYTTDPAQADRVANKIDAGMVYVNVTLADSPELPFGGVKRSGTSREMGLLAADEFVNKKLIRAV